MTDSARFKSGELQVQSVTTFQPHLHRQSDRRPELDGKVPPPGINVPTTRIMGSATKHYDRATNAHFGPDKPRGATTKSLIVLNPWLSLNQRVPGSSPGAPTTQSPETRNRLPASRKAVFMAISRVWWSPISGLSAETSSSGPFWRPVSGAKNPVPNSKRAG